MIKSELIQKLSAGNPHLYPSDLKRIVTAIFGEIAAALARGDRIELRGFGALFIKKRDALSARNPRTGASINVTEKHIPFFKSGKLIHQRLNGALPVELVVEPTPGSTGSDHGQKSRADSNPPLAGVPPGER
jgi:integration host factor subunit beta